MAVDMPDAGALLQDQNQNDAIMTVETVEEYVPHGHAHRHITSVFKKLREQDSVCVKIQAEKRTLAEVQLLLDACADKYPIMADYLSPSGDIVHSPLFESAIVKLQNELLHPLTSGAQWKAPLSLHQHRKLTQQRRPTSSHPLCGSPKQCVLQALWMRSKTPYFSALPQQPTHARDASLDSSLP
ncbi:hypothetical protein PC121_g11254 [Phytophthora cactorum]|nr:hypothetical protein PC120_g21136 [Phytophthora cactorum]KAG3065650.1 hypothetical protein PC121_g11254 [Phytophthora cactorum]